MLSSAGDIRSGTVPVSGLQYTTSPSLPSAVKAARDAAFGGTTASAAFPSIATGTVNSSRGISAGPVSTPMSDGPLPHGALQLYDSYFGSLRGVETTPASAVCSARRRSADGGSLLVPDELSGIGPSARRLLQMEAVQQQEQQRQQQQQQGRSKKVLRMPAIQPVASRTLPLQYEKARLGDSSTSAARPATTTNTAAAAAAGGAALSATAPLPAKSAQSAGRRCTSATRKLNTVYASSAASRQLDRTLDVRPPALLSTVMNAQQGSYGTTVPAAAAPPPLVSQMQSYIKRELILNSGGAVVPSAMDQLAPYREAFRALCSAFPAYASLFDDIQCAYDNVIQAQAELLTDAYTSMVTRDVEKATHQERSAALNEQVTALQQELATMQVALESRAQVEEEERALATLKSRTGRGADIIELRRELEAAHQRVAELERNSQSDLEKIMVLIGAVRECDRRLKEYERLVASVTGQVSELDEFKRIAGEAQTELMQFRKKYSDYVPVADFRLMKEYLTAELETAQLMTRRWRRTAAVRGTQLDVMQRRLASFEEEREGLIKVAEAAAATSATAARLAASSPSVPTHHRESDSGSDSEAVVVLTPRPSWRRVYERCPELSEYASDVGPLTTELDRDAGGSDGMANEVEDRGASGRKASLCAGGLPVVRGPKETVLQVDFLVDRLAALEGQLRTERQQQQQQQQASQRAGTTSETTITSPGAQRGNSPRGSQDAGFVRSREKSADGAAAPTTMVRRNSRRTHGVGDALSPSMTAALGAPIPRMAPPLELPLLGLGNGPQVLAYLRASGVLTRRSAAPVTVVCIAYHFFLDVLPTFMVQEDEREQNEAPAAAASAAAAPLPSTADRLAPFVHEMLQSEMQVREDLQWYDSVAHLMMNLERDGERREWCTDALHLFLWVIRGLMPPRVAVDPAVVLAQVKRDIRALAKELQSSRLRRQALGECLQPVLELKTATELAELRSALGGETTFNADALCSDTHPFMLVLFVQECRASIDLYLSVMRALSSRAAFLNAEGGRSPRSAQKSGSRDGSSSAMPQLEDGERVLSLTDVSEAILEVEPATPEVVLRELSLNAVSQVAPIAVPRTDPATNAGGAAGATETPAVVRLSDIVRAVAAAPLIRRTAQSTKEECTL